MALISNYKPKTKTSSQDELLLQLIASNPKLQKEIEKAQKPKVSPLNKLFGLLSAGETAPAVYEYLGSGDAGKSLETYGKEAAKGVTLQGMEGKKTYEDVLVDKLGMKKGVGSAVAGLAGDILLDPTTYVGGAIVKGVGKATKGVAKATGKAATKIPKVGKYAGKAIKTGTKVVNTLEDLFSPTAKFKRMGPVGEEFSTKLNTFYKGVRYEEGKAVKEALTSKKTASKLDKNISEKVADFLETGGKVGEDVGGVGTKMQKGHKKMLEELKSRNLVDNEVENYMFHAATKEAKEAGIDTVGYLDNAIKARKVKSRTVDGLLKEINEKSLKENGYKMFEDDVFKAYALKEIDTIGKIRSYDFINQVTKDFSKTTDEFGRKITEPKVIEGIKYISYTPEIPGAKKLFLPEEIARELKGVNKIISNDEAINSVLKMYDKLNTAFKGSVTGWYPGFHGRNLLGGIFNNLIAGVKNPARYIDGEKFANKSDDIIKGVELAGKPITYKELNELALKYGATGDQGIMDTMRSMEDLTKGLFATKKGQFKQFPRKVMNVVEDRLRGTLIIDRLKKGDTMEQAVKQVWKYHFDYAPEALAPFEREFMRRVIPFYRWTRGNIPLQLEQMAKQPGKYAAVGKTSRTLGGEEQEMLPEYMREGINVKIGEKDGIKQYLYGIGLPVEDVNKLQTKDMVSMLTPFLKYPAEVYANKNFFFDRPLDESNTPNKSFREKAPKWLKDAVGYNEATGKADPKRWHFLTSFLGRLVATSTKAADPDVSGGLRSLYLTTGIKPKNIDPETETYWRGREMEDKISQLLFNKGYLKKFSNYYVPKEK